MGHVILIGMMGTGKTTVGRILAQLKARNLIDTDLLIEKREGRSISEIIGNSGEEYFRMIEKNVILSIDLKTPSVIAAGGGAVMNDEIHSFFKNAGRMVYLRASADTIYKRTSNLDTRPLLMQGDRLEIIKTLLNQREQRYLDCDVVIESDNRSPMEIANDIARRLDL